jgi:apolipoprotein N-acyltransferase
VGTRAITTAPDAVFGREMAATAGVQPPVGLVLWPESTLVSQVPFAGSKGGVMLAALASRLGTTVVAGVEQRHGPRRAQNLVVAYAPSGALAAVYVKHHLVPFGEYVPARRLLRHVVDLRDTPFDTVAGSGVPVLTTPAGRLGVMVSFEVFFDGAARSAARAGGLLVVPTDTASYRDAAVTGQELAACRLRALETGRDLVVVSPTGVSAVVDAGGDVVVRTRIGVAAVVERTVSQRQGLTIFDEVGAWPVLAVSLLGLALPAVFIRPSRPRPSPVMTAVLTRGWRRLRLPRRDPTAR